MIPNRYYLSFKLFLIDLFSQKYIRTSFPPVKDLERTTIWPSPTKLENEAILVEPASDSSPV